MGGPEPPPPTCDGKIEILEVLDLPGALTGRETLVKGFEEVGKGQLHVRDGRPPVLAVVGPHRPDKQALESEERWVKLPDRGEAGCPTGRSQTITEFHSHQSQGNHTDP